MRYRKLSPTGDYTFGSGLLNFYINSPDAVAQAVKTSLLLWLNEWYLNLDDGTPYMEGVIGKHNQETADATLRNRIMKVQGMVSIQDFQSTIDPDNRTYTLSATLNTIYGVTQLQVQNYANF